VTTTDATATDPTPTVTSSAPAETPTTDATPDPFDAVTVKSVTPATPPPAPAESTAAPTQVKKLPRRHATPAKRPPTRQLQLMPIPVAALEFDPQSWLRNNAASATGASAVAIAEHYLGVPYRWGGDQPATGFDCSGLTQFVYDQLGVYLPHYAASQFDAYTKLDPSQLQPGDLVFFEPKVDGPGHVAIYIGNDQIIEAPHTGALIRISSLTGEAAKLGFLGAVRPYTDAQIAASPLASLHTRLA
jgi:cell wall-associated NlpC family hydrolase